MLKPKAVVPPLKELPSQTQPIPIKRQSVSSFPSYSLSASPDRRAEIEFSDLIGSPPSDKPKIRSRD